MPQGEGFEMLGPALTQLLVALDVRKDRQTSYERRLYRELLVLKIVGDKFAEEPLSSLGSLTVGSVSGLAAAVPAGLALQGLAKHSRSFDVGPNNIIVGLQDPVDFGLENIIVGLQDPVDPGLANIIVGPLETVGGPIRLQINCNNPTCPNKEFR
jgi:hypothetical protein